MHSTAWGNSSLCKCVYVYVYAYVYKYICIYICKCICICLHIYMYMTMYMYIPTEIALRAFGVRWATHCYVYVNLCMQMVTHVHVYS